MAVAIALSFTCASWAADEPVKAKATSDAKANKLKIEEKPYGKTADGEQVVEYTLTSSSGLSAKVISYGATLTSVMQPDRDGKAKEITLGFDKLDGYLGDHPFFGVSVGRFCNRIAKGEFTLDDKKYSLAKNNGPNHLHGGKRGFDKYVWKATTKADPDGHWVEVVFSHTSPDGDEGYPGKLQVTSSYTLYANDMLSFKFTAETDKATVLNLTNHAYWNLAGHDAGDVLGHELSINADSYLPVDATSIPTGELKGVAGTAMDFQQPHKVGERIGQVQGGYDHCFALNKGDERLLGKVITAATVVDPKSGRAMEISTNQPGIQFYTGNYLSAVKGRGGASYEKHGALCLETQHYPDSPNQPKFPTTVLKPGQKFERSTSHRFYIKK